MEKIIVIGCCGSGKSVFSRGLRDKLKLPLYPLDLYFWKPNWEHITNEELIDVIKNIIKNDKWIIDGNYQKSLELRMEAADTIFFLDLPEEVCVESERQRRGTKREDLPSYLEEVYDPEFEEFIKSFKDKARPFIYTLLEKYKDKNIIIFKSRDEVNSYLNSL